MSAHPATSFQHPLHVHGGYEKEYQTYFNYFKEAFPSIRDTDYFINSVNYVETRQTCNPWHHPYGDEAWCAIQLKFLRKHHEDI